MKKLVALLILYAAIGCQVSHPAKVMYNPATGDRVIVSHHGTGKLGSALAARKATEVDVESLKIQGYQEEISH